ncbi:MAG TPA: Uma2 family endonuclease, partial [Tepidisphaeraceae bacterium]
MDDVLEPLARSPKLPQYLNELQILMKNEADARQRFRDWLDEDKKAEFINGEIILHSPAKYQHNNSRSYISRLLGLYVDVKQIGKVQDEKALISLSRNDYEPD